MKYYKGLYYGELYNVAFLGGWRCGEMQIGGHYCYVTDLKKFVFWQFGDYANFTSITEKYIEPKLSEVEQRFANDCILEQIRRDMYSSQNPNLTDIAHPMWNDIYGDTRELMVKQWEALEKYPFLKHNSSLNIDQGDTVENTETGEIFKVEYFHDVVYINKKDKYKLVERYDYFPELTLEKLRTPTVTSLTP